MKRANYLLLTASLLWASTITLRAGTGAVTLQPKVVVPPARSASSAVVGSVPMYPAPGGLVPGYYYMYPPSDLADPYTYDPRIYMYRRGQDANSPARNSPSAAVTEQGGSDYLAGNHWAADARNRKVTWEQFVAFLKTSIVKASATTQTDFRNGFADGYGADGATLFDQAFRQAQGLPPIIRRAQPAAAPAR